MIKQFLGKYLTLGNTRVLPADDGSVEHAHNIWMIRDRPEAMAQVRAITGESAELLARQSHIAFYPTEAQIEEAEHMAWEQSLLSLRPKGFVARVWNKLTETLNF